MPVPYNCRMPDETADFIRHTHPEIRKKIKSSLEIILSDPHAGKSLKEELTGLKSFRVGRFRIIYRISSKQIIDIVAVGPRRIIYEITYRLLKKETGQNESFRI
ncbi:MAG: type II toxin-antitoxin system RelE/ParE family toxin [Deltaproteobacteria bacterium]|jgi:mRNA interferase RelE/StbE|nr:type II toxin-antitoxin system RelE/ParE family toxin [Deltaproteobacteria bacterium]